MRAESVTFNPSHKQIDRRIVDYYTIERVHPVMHLARHAFKSTAPSD